MKNKIILHFCIWKFNDITHDEITSRLALKPSIMHIKGQRRNPKFPMLAKENGWLLEADGGDECSFEEKMNFLMSFFKGREDILSEYGNKYYCEVSCVIYINVDAEESTPWVHLNRDQIAILNQLSIEFDVDIILVSD